MATHRVGPYLFLVTTCCITLAGVEVLSGGGWRGASSSPLIAAPLPPASGVVGAPHALVGGKLAPLAAQFRTMLNESAKARRVARSKGKSTKQDPRVRLHVAFSASVGVPIRNLLHLSDAEIDQLRQLAAGGETAERSMRPELDMKRSVHLAKALAPDAQGGDVLREYCRAANQECDTMMREDLVSVVGDMLGLAPATETEPTTATFSKVTFLARWALMSPEERYILAHAPDGSTIVGTGWFTASMVRRAALTSLGGEIGRPLASLLRTPAAALEIAVDESTAESLQHAEPPPPPEIDWTLFDPKFVLTAPPATLHALVLRASGRDMVAEADLRNTALLELTRLMPRLDLNDIQAAAPTYVRLLMQWELLQPLYKYLFAIGIADHADPTHLIAPDDARNTAVDELAKRTKTPAAVLQSLPATGLNELALRHVGAQSLRRWLHGSRFSPPFTTTFGLAATPGSVFAAFIAQTSAPVPLVFEDLRNTVLVEIASALSISETALQHRLDYHFFSFSALHGKRDAHLEQLAKWFLLSPLQRFLFARGVWHPTAERQFLLSEEELANMAKESMRIELSLHASYLATLSVIEVEEMALELVTNAAASRLPLTSSTSAVDVDRAAFAQGATPQSILRAFNSFVSAGASTLNSSSTAASASPTNTSMDAINSAIATFQSLSAALAINLLDWHDVSLHQLAAWFLHTPIERFLIATKRIGPHASRLQSNEERNTATGQLLDMDPSLRLDMLQELPLDELEQVILQRTDVRAARFLSAEEVLLADNATVAPHAPITTVDSFRALALTRNVRDAATLSAADLRNAVIQTLASLTLHSIAVLQTRNDAFLERLARFYLLTPEERILVYLGRYDPSQRWLSADVINTVKVEIGERWCGANVSGAAVLLKEDLASIERSVVLSTPTLRTVAAPKEVNYAEVWGASTTADAIYRQLCSFYGGRADIPYTELPYLGAVCHSDGGAPDDIRNDAVVLLIALLNDDDALTGRSHYLAHRYSTLQGKRDGHIEQLAAYFLLTPRERFMLHLGRFDPHARTFVQEEGRTIEEETLYQITLLVPKLSIAALAMLSQTELDEVLISFSDVKDAEHLWLATPARPLNVGATFGPAATTESVFQSFTYATHVDSVANSTEELVRNSVIDKLHVALNTSVESLQDMTAAYLERYCKWFLLSPLRRFLFSIGRWDPHTSWPDEEIIVNTARVEIGTRAQDIATHLSIPALESIAARFTSAAAVFRLPTAAQQNVVNYERMFSPQAKSDDIYFEFCEYAGLRGTQMMDSETLRNSAISQIARRLKKTEKEMQQFITAQHHQHAKLQGHLHGHVEQLAKYFALSASERFLFEERVFDPHTTVLPPDAARNTLIAELRNQDLDDGSRKIDLSSLTTEELESRVAKFAQTSSALIMRVTGTPRPKNIAYVFAIDLQPLLMLQSFCYYMDAYNSFEDVTYDDLRNAAIVRIADAMEVDSAQLQDATPAFLERAMKWLLLTPVARFVIASYDIPSGESQLNLETVRKVALAPRNELLQYALPLLAAIDFGDEDEYENEYVDDDTRLEDLRELPEVDLEIKMNAFTSFDDARLMKTVARPKRVVYSAIFSGARASTLNVWRAFVWYCGVTNAINMTYSEMADHIGVATAFSMEEEDARNTAIATLVSLGVDTQHSLQSVTDAYLEAWAAWYTIAPRERLLYSFGHIDFPGTDAALEEGEPFPHHLMTLEDELAMLTGDDELELDGLSDVEIDKMCTKYAKTEAILQIETVATPKRIDEDLFLGEDSTTDSTMRQFVHLWGSELAYNLTHRSAFWYRGDPLAFTMPSDDLVNAVIVKLCDLLSMKVVQLNDRVSFMFHHHRLLQGYPLAYIEKLAKWFLLSPIERFLFAKELYNPEEDVLDHEELRELFINAVVNDAGARTDEVIHTNETAVSFETAAAAAAAAATTAASALKSATLFDEEEEASDTMELHEYDLMNAGELEAKARMLLGKMSGSESATGVGMDHTVIPEIVTRLVAHDTQVVFPVEMAFGERATPQSIFAAFCIHLSYYTAAEVESKTVPAEDYRNSVITGLAQAMQLEVAKIQEASENSDWYLSQLCQWYLMTPLERFIFAARKYEPNFERLSADDVQNSAIVLLSNLTGVSIPTLQDRTEFQLEELVAPFVDVHAIHEKLTRQAAWSNVDYEALFDPNAQPALAMRAFCDFKLNGLYCAPEMSADDVRNTIVDQLSIVSGLEIRHVQAFTNSDVQSLARWYLLSPMQQMLYSHNKFDAKHDRDEVRNSAITEIATLEAAEAGGASLRGGAAAGTSFMDITNKLQLYSEEELHEEAMKYIVDIVLVEDEGLHEMYIEALEKLLKHVGVAYQGLSETDLANSANTVMSKMTKLSIGEVQTMTESEVERKITAIIDLELQNTA